MQGRSSFLADSSETYRLCDDNGTLQRVNSRVNIESECALLLPES